MRNRLRGTMLSAAAGVAAAAAPSGDAAAQLPVPPTRSEAPAGRYRVPAGVMPPAGPGQLADALPPGLSPGGMPPGMLPPGPGTPGATGPGMMPDTLRPYPRISPYDHRFDQTFHDGNLWMREMNNSPRKFYGSASYTSSRFKTANRTTIGARRSLEEVVEELFAPQFVGSGVNTQFQLDTIANGIQNFTWVKSAFIPFYDDDGTIEGYQFYGLTINQRLDQNGFLAGTARLTPYFDTDIDLLDDDVSPDVGDLADDPFGDDLFIDAIGYQPITGDVFGSGGNQNLLPGFDPIFSTRFDEADNPGIRGRFGFEDADGSGFEWTAEWISEDADVFSRGDRENARRFFEDLTNFDSRSGVLGSQPTRVDRPNRDYRTFPLGVIVVDVNQDLLNARLFGTPIAKGPNAEATVPGGQLLPDGTIVPTRSALNPVDGTLAAFTYDLLYENEFTSEQAGTEMSFLFTPVLKRGKFRVRPSAGLRFNFLQEAYRFDGSDSGAIEIFDPGADIAIGAEAGDIGGIVGPIFAPPSGPGIVNPFTGSSDIGDLIPIFPYQSRLVNEVQSYLFGPQVGLHFDLPGKFLSLNGHVKGGVAGLQERIRLDGFGFNLNQHITGDLMPFDSQQTHSRLSPFADFNVRGDLNLFPYVPVINRLSFLKNARFTGGFSGTIFGEVSRPLDAVVWREANSGNPFINADDSERSALYYTNWDLGVAWRW